MLCLLFNYLRFINKMRYQQLALIIFTIFFVKSSQILSNNGNEAFRVVEKQVVIRVLQLIAMTLHSLIGICGQ